MNVPDGPVVLRGHFVLLRAQQLRLLLTQAEVGVAEYVEEAPRATALPGRFLMGHGGQAREVVALSAQMRPLAVFPPDRFVLTRLHAGDADLSFAWNEARVLIDAPIERWPLPPAMRVPGAPINGYVEHQGELYLCTTAACVAACAVEGGN